MRLTVAAWAAAFNVRLQAVYGEWLNKQPQPWGSTTFGQATVGYDSLRRPEVTRRLRGAWVMSLGDDLHLHLSTAAADFPDGNPGIFAARAAREAALAALARGR